MKKKSEELRETDSRGSDEKSLSAGIGLPRASISTTILLIEDDERDRRMLLASLRDKYQVLVAADYTQAQEKISRGDFDIVFLDLMLPRTAGEKVDENGKFGLDLLRLIRESDSLTPVVVISGLATVKTAMKVLSCGIVDFIVKDDLEDQLPVIMRRAEMIRQGRVEQLILRRESRWTEGAQKLVYRSEAMKDLLAQVAKTAASDFSALISGETGTGKELIAREIHRLSPRSSSPFVPVNCGAIPASLVESELFGYEKGAFTGAEKRKHGLVELAHNGTLFLDEIGDLPLDSQVRLLRVLQERVFRRVGGEKEFAVNIRIVAATNKDLLKEVAAHRFREDLYYRLAPVKLWVRPLRERLDDLEPLGKYFLQKYAPGANITFSAKALKMLKAEAWPGNIRELESVVQRALMGPQEKRAGRVIQARELVKLLPDSSKPAALRETVGEYNLTQIERRVIAQALGHFPTQEEASKQLGISLSQLRRKLQDFGIDSKPKVRTKKIVKNLAQPIPALPNRRAELLKLAATNKEFTTRQAVEILGVSRKTAIAHLNDLALLGEVQRIGRGRYGKGKC